MVLMTYCRTKYLTLALLVNSLAAIFRFVVKIFYRIREARPSENAVLLRSIDTVLFSTLDRYVYVDDTNPTKGPCYNYDFLWVRTRVRFCAQSITHF